MDLATVPRETREEIALTVAEIQRRKVPFARLPLYPKQAAIIDDQHRFTITEATTKAGKTMSHIEWLLERAIEAREGQWWWVAPVKSQADIAFRRSRDRLRGFIDSRGAMVRVAESVPFAENKTHRTIDVAGATLWFKSADEPDSLYGEDVRGGVGDEITRWKHDSWIAFYSTLAATKGPAKLIGNVKGRRNFAYHLARKAQAGEPDWGWHKLTADDAIEGGIIDAGIVEQAKRDLPPERFRELFYAEAAESGSNPFGAEAIRRNVGIQSSLPPVVFGVDLAKHVDWTWLVGLDRDGRWCVSERWQSEWAATYNTVERLVGKVPLLVDSTGVGDPVLEELRRRGLHAEGYHFHPASKQRLMEGLAAEIQSDRVTYPAELAAELEDYEYEYTRTGVQYSAPPGAHDDGVCALALAVEHGNARRLLHRPVPKAVVQSQPAPANAGSPWA